MHPDEFLQQLTATVAGPAATSLTMDTVLNDLPQWDSMTVLVIIDMVETRDGLLLPGVEILGCRTVRDLHQLIERQRAVRASTE